MIKHYFSKSKNSFYVNDIHTEIPDDAVEITIEQHSALLDAINQGSIIFDDLSFSEPKPSPFHQWIEKSGKWVENRQEKQNYYSQLNTDKKVELLRLANEKITLLQDAVELGLAKKGDEAKLQEWKKYRVLLNQLKVTAAKNMKWPAQPEAN